MPAAVLTQANALRWLGSAQYELAGLLLILNGQTRYGATLTIEQERYAPCSSNSGLYIVRSNDKTSHLFRDYFTPVSYTHLTLPTTAIV